MDQTTQLLQWIEERPRTRSEVLEAWRTSCPRQATWEDVLTAGLVGHENGTVVLTQRGRQRLRDGPPKV
jgi:hypothetical protein